MENNLLWSKYQPSNLEDIILLPRVREAIEDGVTNHLVLHGHYGTGKTSLANILVGDKPTLKRNTSLHTSIEILRNDISDHINKMSMFDSSDGMKYIYLEEFEQASSQYQDGLKAFMDDYRDKVRFIFTTNHIHKVSDGIISRGKKLDFTPRDNDEVLYLKKQYAIRLMEISKKESISIEKEDIMRIVTHNFPDMRQMVNVLQHVKETGKIDYSDKVYNFTLQKEMFDIIISKKDMGVVQNFILNNFGDDKVHEMLLLCGRPLIEFLVNSDRSILSTERLGDIVSVVTEYTNYLNNFKGGDPIILGMSCIHKIQKIL